MEQHLKIVAILNIVFSAIWLILIIFAAMFFLGAGLLSDDPGDLGAIVIFVTIVGGFFGIFTIPGIIAGFGLLKKKEWARILAIILAFIDLINFPFGTAIGIYTLVILFNRETIQIIADANAEPVATPAN